MLRNTLFTIISIAMLTGCSSEIGAAGKKEVSVCTGYAIGSETDLNCDGSVKDKTTLKKMYENGWKLEQSVAGGYKFILIFTK